MKLINQAELIQMIADRTLMYKIDVQKVFEALETVVVEQLTSASIDEGVEIKLFNGCKLAAQIKTPESTYNIYGEQMKHNKRIRYWGKFSKHFKKQHRLTNEWWKTLKEEKEKKENLNGKEKGIPNNIKKD